jgi:hypothetical protein
MKSIFQIQSELNANEKLTNNEATNIMGGLRFNRSRKNRYNASNSVFYTVSRFIVADETGAAEDDKRRQRPGGGTTTTSPIN